MDLLIAAEQKFILQEQNSRLQQDVKDYETGTTFLKLALDRSQAESNALKKTIDLNNSSLFAYQKLVSSKEKELRSKDRKIRRAKVTTKISSFVGLAGITAAIILFK